jgi:hypothetical protein
MSDTITFTMKRKALVAMHHLHGDDAIETMGRLYVDELKRELKNMTENLDYMQYAAETDLELVAQARAQEKIDQALVPSTT